MSFEDEMASLETSIGSSVTAALSNIRKILSGNDDFVLADTDDNFKRFFLETAKNKIEYAYNAYLMQTKFKNLIGPSSNNNSAAETQKALLTHEVLVTQKALETQTNCEESKSSTAVQSDSRQFPNSFSDISAIKKNRELQLQNELQNSLYVIGLPSRGDDQKTLLSMFKILCNHLLVSLDETDIESIQSYCHGLTVTFHKQYKKDQVKMNHERHDRGKGLKSDQVLRLLPGEISTPIKIHQKDTEFYRKLCAAAQCYVNRKQLYCHRITSHGLGIMFNRSSEFVFVQSQYELHEQVSRHESMKKK